MTTHEHANHTQAPAVHNAHAEHGAHAAHGDNAAHAGHDHHAAHVGHAGHQAPPAHTEHEAHAAHANHAGAAEHGAHAAHGGGLPGGLQITQDGYTLDLAETIVRQGEFDLRFRILGPDGRPVTDYTPIHDRELHLIVARRELTGFWHVHPTLDPDGTWAVRITLPEAGAYRAFTDVEPRALGRTITLGADFAVAGAYEPLPVPEPDRVAVIDDYTVTLDGDLVPEQGGLLTLTVRKGGEPVTDLQPYLAAFGHLVILRAGDLAYIHVHPNGAPGDGVTAPGPDITFHTVVPGPGTYRLFLDFKHGDTVRTAAFTLPARRP